MLIAATLLLLLRIGFIATAAAETAAAAAAAAGAFSATSSHDGLFLGSSSSSSSSSSSARSGVPGELGLPARSSASLLALQQNTTDFFFANSNCSDISVAAVENKILPLGKGVANILTPTKRAAWYKDTLTSLVVEYCEEALQGAHGRYVARDNATAAKDEYGTCVEAADGDQDVYAAGLLCERNANCYWEGPKEGQARSRRYTDDAYADDESAAREYMQGLVLRYGTLGFLLAVAVFVGSVKFAVSRGIFNKCVCDGDLQRERTGYTTTEQKAPAAIFVAGFIVVAGVGFLGLQGNSNVTTGLDAMLTTTDGAIEGIHDLVSSVSSPLSGFVNSLNASAEEARTLISGADGWLGELEEGVLLRLAAFDSAHRHRFQGRGAEFDTLAAAVEDAGAAFVSDVVTGLSAAMAILQVDFLDMQSIMEGQGHNVLAALTVLNGTAAGLHDHLAYFRTLSDEYLGARTGGVQALVACATFAGAVGLLGVAAGLTESKSFAPCINLLRLTCVVTAITTWTAFILSSLLIVSVVTWSDGCHFLELAATGGWEAAGLDGQSAGVLDGCFRGRPVAQELNLTDALGFFESYAAIAEEVGALDVTSAATQVETAVYAISDFIDSLNSTAIAVSLLDFFTDAKVNGSLLLAPDCLYNVTFVGDDATEFLDRPWLALPTVTVVAMDDDEDDDNGDNDENSSFNATSSNSTSALTPWEAGGTRQSFGRQGDESASIYMSRIFNSSDCTALNDDLLSAWKFAARTHVIRDQMKDDLNCTTTTATATATATTTTSDGADTDTTAVVEECPGNSSSSSPSSSSSSFVTISSSSSSIYPFSSCPSCTSDSYTAPDSLLAYFRTFVNGVDDLRAELSGLLDPLLETPDGLGSLANSSESMLLACCASRCSFLSSHYANFEGAMCGEALSGVAQAGFALFFLGVGGLALAVTSGVMVHRLKANWARNLAKVLSTEEGIVMEEY